jgi:hypothetical protein
VETSRYVALAPEVDAFREQFEEIASEVVGFVDSLTDAQFCWKPGPDEWSVEECVEHLNATARSYLPCIDHGIHDAVARNFYSGGPFQYNRVGRFVVYLLEPPPRFRTSSPQAFKPGPKRARAEMMAGFRAFQVQFVDRLRQASGLHLAKARVQSPFTRWLRIPLGSSFAAMIAHERRHLWQMRRIANRPGFPTGQGKPAQQTPAMQAV